MHRYNSKENLLGQDWHFLEILDRVSLVAAVNKPVLIIGERGTGKELIAERIHYLSARWEQVYVKLNCATLNENVLESELFGHEPGAFTGAGRRHQGRFERADCGTLFLDEVANTSGLVQEKLLNVIEYGEFERVGGRSPIKTDVRLICATNEDLPSLVKQGDFRADLLDRLAFDVITLPPLRERPQDILILAEAFAVSMARELELTYFAGFTDKAKELLQQYHWPGNVRELKNAVERSLYRQKSPTRPLQDIILDPFDSPYRPLPPETVHTTTDVQLPLDFNQVTAEHEIALIRQALLSGHYSQKRAAQLLGLTYHQLRGLLKKYQLPGDKKP